MNANEKSVQAQQTSCAASLWLEHPYVAHSQHESAAAAHDAEAIGTDRDYHLRMAIWHRSCAQYWAKKELERSVKRQAEGEV